jgi:predicted transcriptional regulator
MPISVRLKPDLEALLDKASRHARKSRSAIIHEALAEFLKPQHPKLGTAIRLALSELPRGAGITRKQPAAPDRRDWKR